MAASAPPPGNLDPSLETAWHPVALGRELRPGGWLQVRLLGRTWTVRRTGSGLVADPAPAGVRERFGVLWLAPAEPAGPPLGFPELLDRRRVGGWLPPLRSAAPAGLIVGALGENADVVGASAGQLRNMATDGRPLQLLIGHGDGAESRVAVFAMQPEDADSTRVYARLMLSAGRGRPLPAPAAVVEEMAALHDRLERLLLAAAARTAA
jgi:hypothetical protein